MQGRRIVWYSKLKIWSFLILKACYTTFSQPNLHELVWSVQWTVLVLCAVCSAVVMIRGDNFSRSCLFHLQGGFLGKKKKRGSRMTKEFIFCLKLGRGFHLSSSHLFISSKNFCTHNSFEYMLKTHFNSTTLLNKTFSNIN